MMIKEKSNPWARLKYAYVLPLAAVAVTAFARPEVSDSMKEISAVKVNDLKEIVETKVLENAVVSELPAVAVEDTAKRSNATRQEKSPLTVVEHMPEYPGGVNACVNFIKENLRYPAEAAAKGIQGRVIVQVVVTDEGAIENAKIVRSVDPALDAEAIRVIKLMPKWKPGIHQGKAVSVKYTLPVTFDLSKAGKVKSTPVSMESSGKPVIGANVLLAGTTSGTISDADGNFVIKVPEEATITVAYVGMQSAKVKAAEKVDVALKPVK